ICLIAAPTFAQQSNPPAERVQKTTPANKSNAKQASSAEPNPTEQAQQQQQKPGEKKSEEAKPANAPPMQEEGQPQQNVKYDMTEAAPVVTHHQITVGGKLLHYTATAGRMPIKDEGGTIDAEMFYVAYTL